MSAPRRLEPDDIPGMLTIETACFPAEAWSEGMVRSQLHRSDAINLGLDERADPSSTALAGLAMGWAAGGVAELLRIAIAPSRRRLGDGQRLLSAFLAETQARGAEEVWLEVRADNGPALALYLRSGFVETGRRPRYYPDGVDAVLMSARLPPVSG